VRAPARPSEARAAQRPPPFRPTHPPAHSRASRATAATALGPACARAPQRPPPAAAARAALPHTGLPRPARLTAPPRPSRRRAPQAAALGLRELQLQAWGGTAPALLASARALQDLRPCHCPSVELTIKLPCTAEGLEAAATLRAARPGSSITVTGVYAAHQALLARAVGADYAAPYLGRMGDAATPEQVGRPRAGPQGRGAAAQPAGVGSAGRGARGPARR
jgi:hypothetical protein